MNPLSGGDTLSPSDGGLSVHYGKAVPGVSSLTVSCINALGPLWICRSTGLQRKVRHVCGQGSFIYSICWFAAHKCKFSGVYFDGTSYSATIQGLKLFYLVSNIYKKHTKKSVLWWFCICFGSPVTWLQLGSMWCLWPFLTLAGWCCDQLCDRLSVSHWDLVFKWRAWKCCQDCYTQYVQKPKKHH